MKLKAPSKELIEAMKAQGMNPCYYKVNKELQNSAILVDMRSGKPFLFQKH